jgi:hypothetical protein
LGVKISFMGGSWDGGGRYNTTVLGS